MGSWPKDPSRFACRHLSRGRFIGNEAAEADGFFRNKDKDLSPSTKTSSVNPWERSFERKVIDQKPRLKVIRCIDEYIRPLSQRMDGLWLDIDRETLDRDLRIKLGDPTRCRLDLCQAKPRVLLTVQGLPLEIAEFNTIAVD